MLPAGGCPFWSQHAPKISASDISMEKIEGRGGEAGMLKNDPRFRSEAVADACRIFLV